MNISKSAPVDLDKWCRYIVNAGHIMAALIILAHVIWYIMARSVLAWPPEIYLRYWIIYPAIGFSVLNFSVGMCVHSPHFSLKAKEYWSLSLFIIFSVYLSLTHDIAKVLLCSYILPILASTIFSDLKLTRRILWMSMAAVLLPGVKLYILGTLNSDMVMEIFVSWFMFICAYFLARVLVWYSRDNIAAILDSHEKATRSEFAFLQAQIKSHFIYNAINTMVSFCYTDSEKAADLLVSFSKYLRQVFAIDPHSAMVPLKTEIDLIRAYVKIEKARFGDLFEVTYHIDPALEDLEIPSFCLQPLVENAIKHGLCKKAGGGTVQVSAKKDGEKVQIRVCDTGTGMPAEQLNMLRTAESANDGVGFYNVAKRIASWENARLDIQSAPGRGTVVTITVTTAS